MSSARLQDLKTKLYPEGLYLLLAILISILLISLREKQDSSSGKGEDDYFVWLSLYDGSTYRYHQNGAIDTQIHFSKLDHRNPPYGDTFEKIRIKQYQVGSHSEIRADHAYLDGHKIQWHFHGNVFLEKHSKDNSFYLQSAILDYNTAAQIAETRLPLQLQQDENIIQAEAGRFYLQERQTKLFRNISSRYSETQTKETNKGEP